ncbi:MAG: hypothetical protein JWO78_1766 [Micavibrio sp.]|nr:hypothetical protein [Micavibrio sp.]
MNAKLLINLSQGILEVEGEPDFVKEMYGDFKMQLHQLSTKSTALAFVKSDNTQLTPPDLATPIDIQTSKPIEKAAKKKPTSGKKESYSLVTSLNTGMPGTSDSLHAFLEKYQPKSNIDKNVVILKYLAEKHPAIKVTLDHLYTCYSHAGLDFPKALRASIVDTGRADKGYGYIDSSSLDDIKVVHKGEILLQSLEKKAKEPVK